MGRSMPRQLLIESGHAVTVDPGPRRPDRHLAEALSRRRLRGHAVVWHLGDEIGTLTPGKQADIAIIEQARKLMHATRHHLGA